MDVIDARLERIITAATHAPSVHNTQPWRVRLTGNRMLVHADPSRQLRHSDPAGREMLISCGAFLFNVRTAARRESLTAQTTIWPNPDDELLVASIEFAPALGPDMDELELSVAIDRRATSRTPFDDQPLDSDVLQEIQAAARNEGADVRLIHPSDPTRSQVLALVRRAELLAGEDAVARGEEAAWTATTPARHDGIPQDLLGPSSTDEEAPVRRFLSSDGAAEFEHRSTLAVLSTPSDSRQDWIAAGEALEHLLLVATTYFVHASFATTVLENPTTRHDLRRVLSLGGWPQMLMRLGYSATHPHTPRRTLEEIVTPGEPGTLED
ncbi:hypothetical protein EQW78_07595 [Oerskovia turbata]|uniref:Uncharacterized protein n=1 Tax=Oerskovia turbata TaxID=1713 RepID=A0A4Q1KXI4_9CELL|nr:nitroreductase family protein [Oerskovia turbata]RXR24753.1 hypothetical protein EQW73_12985 [Oerskovia turbata]RXR35043.1 hypothetical protein EQW78_07595 [Oerskovia turbata]TGJ97109.1 hypothetical protein DLJ96_03525 [Actinotalea fermentans ATCC 43279 = JCM 9966 = DSM 3133]